MGKHRHKKSFYDVDEDELESSDRHRHHHRRRRHSSDKQEETKQRVPSISSFTNSKIDDDEAALQSPPPKRQRSSSNSSQSSSKVLAQLIENPEFLANAGPKAKEFAETARQLLSKPDLDPTTQQIICAMAQAAVNVGKRLSSSSSTPADQCVDDLSVTSTTYSSSSTLLSPTLSNTSSSSTSTTPHQQFNSTLSHEENKTSTEPESDEDILIKQMIERAMKLTQQGDTRHAQHLLGLIHEKLSNKRKRAAAAAATATSTSVSNFNEIEKLKIPSTIEFHSSSPLINEDYSQSNQSKISPNQSEQSNNYQNMPCFSYPPPPPLPPPPPPPPTSPPVPVPPIDQVQELLSNPSELQDILRKLRSANENPKVLPPEEYQIQSHLASASSYYSQPSPISFNHPLSSRLNNYNNQIPRVPPPSAIANDSQPYNSSLAFMQGNRRNLPPLQTTDRCFSSSTNKNKPQQSNRSFSYSSTNNNGIMPLLANTSPQVQSAPPLMKINPTFSYSPSTPTPLETVLPHWPITNDPSQRGFHPFWCATCALGFPHQVAYQEHLGSHVSCTVPGCSYAASEQLVRIHHANIHESSVRNRVNNHILHPARPLLHQQQPLEPPWPLMRM